MADATGNDESTKSDDTTTAPPAPDPAPADTDDDVVIAEIVDDDAPTAESAEPAPAPANVVYVQTPAPPKKRGNRIVGVLLAVVGAVVFAVLYAAVAALVISLTVPGVTFGPAFGQFLASNLFWVPVFVFLLGFILLVLLVNRAGWWTHVLGLLVVAFFVYFGSIGLILVVELLQFRSGEEIAARFGIVALNPLIIASAIVAREVSIWIGLAIAARGRRVKARNTEARAAFDRELAEKRAEHERQAAAAS